MLSLPKIKPQKNIWEVVGIGKWAVKTKRAAINLNPAIDLIDSFFYQATIQIYVHLFPQLTIGNKLRLFGFQITSDNNRRNLFLITS